VRRISVEMVTERARLAISRKRAGVACAVVGLAAAGGGLAFGAIPGPGGQIDACFTKSGGTLRVIDATTTRCSSKEQSLAWSVQGPQGAQGPKGDPGEKGATGDPGPSDAIVTRQDANVTLGANFDPITTTNLPAGSWVVSATANALGGGSFACRLTAGDQDLDIASDSRVRGTPDSLEASHVSLQGWVTAAAGHAVQLQCRNGGPEATLIKSTVTAIKVGSLTVNDDPADI
jgi:hypothetical protein